MIPKAFQYEAPTTLEAALKLLQEGGEGAKVLAGGHSLIPLLKLRLAEADLLVDIGRIAALRGAAADRVGALTTYAELAAASGGGAAGLLGECASQVGDVQVRNRGTIGGSLAHADPAADLPAAVLALEAEIEAAGPGGTTRRIAAADFFTDLLTSALEPGEILTGLHLPALPARTGTAYVKLRNKASHYALVGVAAVVTLDEGGNIARAVLAVTGAAAVPFRFTAGEDALAGGNPANGAIGKAAALLADHDTDWMADLHGSADYRRQMAVVIAERALRRAAERA